MSQFMLFVRGGYDSEANLSPKEIQQRIEKYRQWAGNLAANDKLVSANKITDEPRILVKNNGAFTVQTPDLTADTVGGYFVIEAADYPEAMALAQECPIFEHGGSLEVREIEG